MTALDWAYVLLLAIPTSWGVWHTARWLLGEYREDQWTLPNGWEPVDDEEDR